MPFAPAAILPLTCPYPSAERIQQALRRDPHAGDLYVFRGRSGKLIKIFWYDGLSVSLKAKHLEKGRFVWPATKDSVVTIMPGQLGFCWRDRLVPSATCVAARGDRLSWAD